MGPRPVDMEQRVRTRPSQAHPLVLVDAAGPWGAGRSHELTKQDHRWGGVAPARMPQQPGDRVQTDRRDAVPRARLRRAGARTLGDGPTMADEALRARHRARAKALRALQAATFRLTACWLRHDRRDTGAAHGGPAPRRWRAEGGCPTPAPPMGWPASVRAVTEHPERLGRLAQALHELVTTWR